MNELIKSERIDMDGTMTTVEIAELVKKKHFHVMRDVKSLIEQGAITASIDGCSEYKDASGKKNPMYNLDFESTMVLVTGYDAVKRAVVISRWVSLEKVEVQPTVCNKKIEAFELELVGLKHAAGMVGMSGNSLLGGIHEVYEGNGVSTRALPQYTEKVRVVASATDLLLKNGCKLKAQGFNKAMVDAGYLEIKERRGSRGKMKSYKVLTEKGLEFGQNDAFKGNSTRVQVHYFEDSFVELCGRVAVDTLTFN